MDQWIPCISKDLNLWIPKCYACQCFVGKILDDDHKNITGRDLQLNVSIVRQVERWSWILMQGQSVLQVEYIGAHIGILYEGS